MLKEKPGIRPQMLLLQLFPSLPLEALLDSLYAHGIHQSPKELLDSYLLDLLGALWLYPLPKRLAWLTRSSSFPARTILHKHTHLENT